MIKQLQKVAKELNEKLGLEPIIDLEGDENYLEKMVKEAGSLVTDGDDLTSTTREIMRLLSVGSAAEQTPVIKEKELNMSEKTKKSENYCREYSVWDSIPADKEILLDELIEQADKQYTMKNGKSNIKQSKLVVKLALKHLVYSGSVIVNENGYIRA